MSCRRGDLESLYSLYFLPMKFLALRNKLSGVRNRIIARRIDW